MASRKANARTHAVRKRERSMDEDMLDGDNATAVNEEMEVSGESPDLEAAGDMNQKSPGFSDDNEDMPDDEASGSSDEAMASLTGSVDENVPGELTDERGMVCTEYEWGVEELKPQIRRGRAKTTGSTRRNRSAEKRGQKASAQRKRSAKR